MWLRGTLPALPTGPPTDCDEMEKVRTQHAHTFAPCRGGFCAQRVRSVRVGLAFEKYLFIALVLVEVSFLALEVTFCPFRVISIWIVNGVDCDIRG